VSKPVKLPRPKGFAECGTCINREFDPFQCANCVNSSNYQDEDSSAFLTLADLREMED